MNRVEQFLNRIENLYRYNKSRDPNFVLTKDMVYTELVFWDLPARYESIELYFNRWIDRFSTRPGIDVFNSKDWSYFCQFVNGRVDCLNAIKVYVPLKSHNMEENVTRIFEFLRANNIQHSSKVGKMVRNDDLVIRVRTMGEAKLIIDYIKSIPNIDNDLNPLNPFTYNCGGIGLANDGSYSYNSEISRVVADYISMRMPINSKAFSDYVSRLASNEKNVQMERIYKIVVNAIGENPQLEKIDMIANSGSKVDYRVIYKAMDGTKEKYNIEQVRTALYTLIRYGNADYFTRYDKNGNACRSLLERFDRQELIKFMCECLNCSSVNVRIDELVDKFVNQTYSDEIAKAKEQSLEKENTIFDYCKDIYQNYGYPQTIMALRLFASQGASAFTNDENEKRRIEQIVSQNEIKGVMLQMIKKSNPNISEEQLQVIEKQNLLEVMIANLAKEYVDIQDQNKKYR